MLHPFPRSMAYIAIPWPARTHQAIFAQGPGYSHGLHALTRSKRPSVSFQKAPLCSSPPPLLLAASKFYFCCSPSTCGLSSDAFQGMAEKKINAPYLGVTDALHTGHDGMKRGTWAESSGKSQSTHPTRGSWWVCAVRWEDASATRLDEHDGQLPRIGAYTNLSILARASSDLFCSIGQASGKQEQVAYLRWMGAASRKQAGTHARTQVNSRCA